MTMKKLAESQISTSSRQDEICDSEKQLVDWDDPALIAACLAGSEQAWLVLITRYSRLIYTIPFRLGFSKGAADEIFQETCLILLEKLATLRHRDRLSSWLITVSRRACIRRLQRQAAAEVPDILEATQMTGTTSEEHLLRAEERNLVNQALQNLPPQCQGLFKSTLLCCASPIL